jgi:hypothetical protein
MSAFLSESRLRLEDPGGASEVALMADPDPGSKAAARYGSGSDTRLLPKGSRPATFKIQMYLNFTLDLIFDISQAFREG